VSPQAIIGVWGNNKRVITLIPVNKCTLVNYFIYDEREHPYDIYALPCYIGLVTFDTKVEIISALTALSFGHFDMRKKSDFPVNI
jgi:hypothetical protein